MSNMEGHEGDPTERITTGSTPRDPADDGDKQKTPQTMEIKIVLLKAESPLLPNQERTESLPTSVTNISTPLLAPIAIPESLSSSPANVKNETRLTRANVNTNNNNNNNNNNNSACRNININCRRRSSASSISRLEAEGASTPGNDFTSTQSVPGTPKHYSHNLYPVDSFAIIEGKAPKAVTKMQTKVDAVGKITGEWGKWQLRTVLLIFLCKIPSSWFMACIIFTAPAPRHGEFYCKPPEELSPQNHTKWIKVSHPEKEEADDHEFNIDFCNVFKDVLDHAHHYYNYEHQEQQSKLWEEPAKNATVIPCKAFEHKSDYPSLITEFDLVCSRDILVAVTQFFHLFGVLTGGILATHLLKYFSPRNVMLFGMITQIICGNLTGHVTSYELHVFFRCLSAVCCAQMYTAGAMIFMDITGGTYRTVVCTLFEQFWSIGVIMLPGVASISQSWSFLYMAISWPTVILIYLWRWIPDSPRWMIQRGRVLEAKAILQECIEMNGTKYCLPHDIDQQLQLQAITSMEAPPPAGWWSIWKGERAVRHMICVHLCWSLYIVVYYGMLLNIRSFSRDHLEINTAIAGLSEICGTFFGLFLILKTKRKWQWTGLFNIVAGTIAISAWLIPESIKGNPRVALLMLSAMISKAAISTTLSILTTCTTELVADEKKRICAYSTIVWARIWLLTAPFVGATVIFGQLVPQTAFASFTIIGGVLSALISSPRTISKQKTSPTTTTTTMTAANNIKSEQARQASYVNQSFNKKSNLPPELIPGIWTTKNHVHDHPHV